MEQTNLNLVTWNLLAKSLCDSESFPKVDSASLDWNSRLDTMKKTIEQLPASVYCFQEVDQIEEIAKLLPDHKYEFKAKEGQNVGNAIFYSEDLKLLETRVIPLFKDSKLAEKATQIGLLLKFEFEEKEFMVVNVHLKAKAEFSETRRWQVESFIKALEKEECPLIVCGDFNADPEEPCIARMRQEFEGLDSAKCSQGYTTLKVRDKLYQRMIDYVFTRSGARVTDWSEAFYSREDCPIDKEIGLPDKTHSSDHLPLKVNIEIN